jgi:hypothetical protein
LVFETVTDRWWAYFRERPGSPERAARATHVVQELDVFVARFPDDGLSGRARVLKVLVRMDQSPTDLSGIPPEPARGSTHDLWQLATARAARLAGKEHVASPLITAMIGKLVDPVARAVFYEELVEMSRGRPGNMVALLDTWLGSVTGSQREPVMARVRTYVASLDKDALEPSLDAIVAARITLVPELRDAVIGRLSTIALTSGDSDLAKKVLDGNLASASLSAVQQDLSELAASRRGTVRIDGRAVGLLLPAQTPALREEAADVLRGMMWALGLPRGVRSGKADSTQSGTQPPCIAREASAFDPPSAFERLRIITRDAPLSRLAFGTRNGNDDDAPLRSAVERELDALLAQGAAVIVGGIDEKSAALMIGWQRKHRVPMVLLSKPAIANFVTDDLTFIIGEDRGVVLEQLGKHLGERTVAPVIDESEVAFYPVGGLRLGPLNMLSPVSCERAAEVAGSSRFPLAAWSKDHVDAWLVTGSHECARRLSIDLGQDPRLKPTIALTLEATMALEVKGHRLAAASAGLLPFGIIRTDDPDLLSYARQFDNDVTWWGAVGRDAGTLVRLALRSVPADETDDPTVMRDRRDRIASALRTVRAPLWTSERSGTDNGQILRRTVCVRGLAQP